MHTVSYRRNLDLNISKKAELCSKHGKEGIIAMARGNRAPKSTNFAPSRVLSMISNRREYFLPVANGAAVLALGSQSIIFPL